MLEIRTVHQMMCAMLCIGMVGLSGCAAPYKKKTSSSRYVQVNDGHPFKHHIPDIAKIQDAVPKHEPMSRYGNPKSYTIANKRYHVFPERRAYQEEGYASWYGTKFHGFKTSNGETYNMYGMTAAHKSLPLPTYVKVTNLENSKSVIVKVNDRGPFHDNRLIDLSYVAAAKLGIIQKGTAKVRVESVLPEKPQQLAEEDLKTYLQIGAFSQEKNAKELLTKVSRIVEQPVQIAPTKTENGQIFRVQIGPIHKKEQIDALQLALSKHQLPPPLLLTQ